MRVAFLATDGVEEAQLTATWRALTAEGVVPELISVKPGKIQSVNALEKAGELDVDHTVHERDARIYDALVLPGGISSLDQLGTDEAAIRFVRAFFEQDKPVAAVCHAPSTLVEADVVRDRTLASSPTIRTDIRNAGGSWVDEHVKLDQKLLTCASPADLEAFNDRFVQALRARRQETGTTQG
jgi:protease I